jgi:hypothetical protein
MKKITLIFALIFVSIFANAQIDSAILASPKVKTNPIIFAEAVLGRSRGWLAGMALNYQTGNHLFTGRWASISKIDFQTNFIILPLIDSSRDENEFALMYGHRFVWSEISLSLSIGGSYSTVSYYNRFVDLSFANKNYFGLPFDITIKEFKNEKRRFKLLWLIPIGKPTAFGTSSSFKIMGNISQRSYIGLGIGFGIGMHKAY